MLTSIIGGLLALASVLLAAPVSYAANAVKVGLVDLAIERANFSDLENVTVRTMTFWTSGTAEARKQDKTRVRSHGEDMVRTMVKSIRAIDADVPVIVYVATPFRADPATGALKLDMDDLTFAYNWFAHEGVRVVGETFVGPASDAQHQALRHATQAGLVVLASAGNGPSHNVVPPYPAAYDEAISISTTALSAELAREKDRDTYVDFSVAPKAVSAIAYRNDPEIASLQGSSAATASATGILSALSLRSPITDRADAVMLLTCVARPTSSFAGGRAWGNGVLVAHEIGAKLRANAHPCGSAA
jgi:Subtilase family